MILITGHRGFIGSHLIKLLKEKDVKYVGFDLVDGFDIRNKLQIETVFQNFNVDTVVHLAALAGVRKGELFPEEYISTNVNGIVNLLECAKRHKVKNFIFFSSSSVYGDQKSPLSESLPLQPKSLYGATKAMGEMLVKASGIPFTIVRPFSVYGENGRKDQVIFKWIEQIKEGKPITVLGDINSSRGYTYVGDLCRGVYELLSTVLNDVINLGGGKSIKLADILEVFIKNVPNLKIDRKEGNAADIFESIADISQAHEIIMYRNTQFFQGKVKEIIHSEL